MLDFTIGGIDATRLAKYRKKNDIVMLKDMDQKMPKMMEMRMSGNGFRNLIQLYIIRRRMMIFMRSYTNTIRAFSLLR